jgi:hypothetical protein
MVLYGLMIRRRKKEKSDGSVRHREGEGDTNNRSLLSSQYQETLLVEIHCYL